MACKLEESLGFIVNVTANAIHYRFSAIIKPHGLAPEQLATMLMIRENPDLTLTQMADRIYKDKTTIARAVDTLEQKGFLVKERDTVDRRAVKVSLTEEGLNVMATVEKIVEPIKALQRSMFSEEELETFLRMLKVLREFDYQEELEKRQIKEDK